MMTLLNNSFTTPLVLVALSVIAFPLLMRWAIAHPKQGVLGYLNVSIALFLAALTAFGRAESFFQVGVMAFTYAIPVLGLSLAIQRWFVENETIRFLSYSTIGGVFLWVVAGLPYRSHDIVHQAILMALLLYGGALFLWHRRGLMTNKRMARPVLIALTMIAFVCVIIALMQGSKVYAIFLASYALACLIFMVGPQNEFWTEPVIIFGLVLIASLWDMWLRGVLPLLSLLSLLLMMGSFDAAKGIVTQQEGRAAQMRYYSLSSLFLLFGGLLALIFYRVT